MLLLTEQTIKITIELTQADYDVLHDYTCSHETKTDGSLGFVKITPAQLIEQNLKDLVIEARDFYKDMKGDEK
jgi:hypothetical protein